MSIKNKVNSLWETGTLSNEEFGIFANASNSVPSRIIILFQLITIKFVIYNSAKVKGSFSLSNGYKLGAKSNIIQVWRF
jgi:hypothetical protein